MSERKSSIRVKRGGSWLNTASNTRSSYRISRDAGYFGNGLGFRIRRRLR